MRVIRGWRDTATRHEVLGSASNGMRVPKSSWGKQEASSAAVACVVWACVLAGRRWLPKRPDAGLVLRLELNMMAQQGNNDEEAPAQHSIKPTPCSA